MTSSRRSAQRRGQRGLSLIEILVSLILSGMVLITVGYIYATQRLNARSHSAVGALQQAANIAMGALRRDITQAGYVGCNSNLLRSAEKRVAETLIVPLSSVATAGVDNFTVDAGSAIRVFNGDAGADVWGGTVPSDVAPDSHVIEVRYGTLEGAAYLNADIPTSGEALTTLSAVSLGAGDDAPTNNGRMGLLSDCASGMIISVASASGTNVNIDPSLPITPARCQHASRVGASCFYWPATMLMPIRVVQYYVADTGTPEVPRRSLFMRKRIMDPTRWAWNTPQQLGENVHALRVVGLGLDVAAPDDPTWKVSRVVIEGGNPAPETLPAADWSRVLRLDVRLSMRTDATAGQDGRPIFRNYENSFTLRTRAAADPS